MELFKSDHQQGVRGTGTVKRDGSFKNVPPILKTFNKKPDTSNSRDSLERLASPMSPTTRVKFMNDTLLIAKKMSQMNEPVTSPDVFLKSKKKINNSTSSGGVFATPIDSNRPRFNSMVKTGG